MHQTTNSVSAASGHFHAVRFYQDDDSLVRMVADFLGEGLAAGEPALAIVTPEHRAALVQELRGRHVDIDQMQIDGSVLMIAARETLAAFMKEGQLNADLFRK